MASVIQISSSLIPRRLWVKHNHFNGLEDFLKFIYFSQKQLRRSLGRSASGLCYILQQCETLHKLSMAFEIQASDSTCIIVEFFPLVFLAACPPAEHGGAPLWTAGVGGLSPHLQHSGSEKSLTWTKPSYGVNTISSYLVSSLSTRQCFRGTHGCYFVLLFSHLVLCLFQAGCDPDQGQSKADERGTNKSSWTFAQSLSWS